MTDLSARSAHGYHILSLIATHNGRQMNGDMYRDYHAGDIYNYGRFAAWSTLEG